MRQALRIGCILRMSIHFRKFSCAHPLPNVTQMGLGLVSVSKLGCYRWVHPQTSDLFIHLTSMIKETSKKDGHGWSTWRDVRSWWNYSVFDFVSLSAYPDATGCDALNTTVNDHHSDPPQALSYPI